MNWRTSSRSLSRTFHERQINPRVYLPRRRRLNLNKNASTRELPPSWLVFSPSHSHGIPLKTIAPEVTQPTHLQKYLAQFKFRSSYPCHRQSAGHHPYPIPWRSFPTLRLGSLDFALSTNNVLILVSIYFVFLDLSGLRCIMSPPKMSIPGRYLFPLISLIAYVFLLLPSLASTYLLVTLTVQARLKG